MNTWVVVPTYNEAHNLGELAAALLSGDVPDLGLVVVDDASPDGTGEVADRLALATPDRMHVVHRPEKGGLGSAYVDGFLRALGLGAELIVQMDADFSHAPSDIHRLVSASSDCDLVLGSRYVPGGVLDERWSAGRRWLSWWANAVWVPVALDLPVRDATSGFRVWRREALEAIDLSRVGSSGYAFQVETLYLALRLGFGVVEVPIRFEERRDGQSKMDLAVKTEAMWRVFEMRWRHRHLGRAGRDDKVVDARPVRASALER